MRNKIRQGQSRSQAVEEVTNQSLHSRHAEAEFSNKGCSKLKKRVYPLSYRSKSFGKISDAWFKLQVKRKRKLIQQTFGITGERLGMINIEPELFGHYKSIAGYLREMGIEILFTKNFVYSRESAYRVYESRHLDRETFPIKMGLLTSGPSKVIVFRHLPKNEYVDKSKWLAHLKKVDPQEHVRVLRKLEGRSSQGYFDLLFKGSHNYEEPGTMREEISKKNSRKHIFDPFGVISRNHPALTDSILAGIHTPRGQEVLTHAVALFSKKELEKIKSKL
ncbi:MAG: hypothetical protein PHD05_06940 [Sphaerochaetaceae bacterium]|nr:hypothetical protein [Sphaerochaetaceae bacterium]